MTALLQILSENLAQSSSRPILSGERRGGNRLGWDDHQEVEVGGGLFQLLPLSPSPEGTHTVKWRGHGWARCRHPGDPGEVLGKEPASSLLNRQRGPEGKLSLKHQARSELGVQ